MNHHIADHVVGAIVYFAFIGAFVYFDVGQKLDRFFCQQRVDKSQRRIKNGH